ncbi:MAG TPA: DNA polymerase [Candidatus Paceibacterota bacterium]|nr:DNA polymerase [Candidatus Paceibacterota bacterium]
MAPKNSKKTKTSTKTLVLLDAHAIIHRAYHALPEFLSSKGEPTGALYGLSSMLMKIIAELRPDYIVACYDLPEKTFRHEAYGAYKAGRKKADEALVSQLINSRKIFECFGIPMYDSPGFEADDILGTIVEKFHTDGGQKKPKMPKGQGDPLPPNMQGDPLHLSPVNIVIASGDMDTMQLVNGKKVQVYTLKKGINDTILYDEEKVIERFGFAPKFLPDYKGLRGDPSDNIIGIKGIGEKTATELIQKFGTIEEIYKNLKKGDIGLSERITTLIREGEEEALFSKTLAKIRSDAPIDFKLPEKTFWETVDHKNMEKVFQQFEFRSLISRLKSFFENSGDVIQKKNVIKSSEVKEAERISDEKIDPEKLRETSIALWLINSEIANPGLSEILNFTNTDSFDKAEELIFKRLEKDNLRQVYEEIEKPIIPTIKEMQEVGIKIDKEYFKKLSLEYHKELDKITAIAYKMAGKEFNLNSPKQLGEILFGVLGLKSKKKSASGSFSTSISVLEELEDKHPIIKKIMEHRELSKLLSTYIDVIPGMVGEDGRLHAEFTQNGASTGRFSSQNPNLQNLPIKSELGKRIRSAFVAEKGWKLAAFDYSQIELRAAAILSGDKKMVQIFKDRKDVHAGVASFVFGVPQDEVTAEMRRQAKVINFGIIYGMGVSALKKNLGGTREEAQKFYDNYFVQFEGLRDYLDSIKKFAEQHGYTLTLFGRRRMFPDINSRIPFLKAMALRTATNAPVQGTATADIIKLAIRHAREDLEKEGILDKVRLVLQIHDELVYEIKEDVLEKAEKVIKNAMETVLDRSFLHYKTDVPLAVHFGAGDNFGEIK